MTLAANQKTVVTQADRQSILLEYQAISKNWSSQHWLQTKNRYRLDATRRIKDDASAGRAPNNAQLRQYIAASSVIHCLDGWSYLGRAIDAKLKGDTAVSCHLAYYAELRAAMALLAAEGIGVFNNTHFVVNSLRQCVRIPKPVPGQNQGTHVFTWEALEYWAGTHAASKLLFHVIEPGGLPLSDWLDSFSIGAGFRGSLATSWLKQWGVDLKRFADDREARNLSSYRPTTFSSASALTPCKSLTAVKEFWRLCEPLQSYRFANLDRHLLKNSLEFYFRHAHAAMRTPKQAKTIYKKLVMAMLHQLTPRDTSLNWETFLTSELGSEIPLLEDAKGTAEPNNPVHSAQIGARAALLLRLATGACNTLLASLPDKNDLRFWWSHVGIDHCLWNIGNEPIQTIDLWADIQDALDDIEQWCRTDDGATKTYQNLWREKASSASTLGTCERVALWGFGI